MKRTILTVPLALVLVAASASDGIAAVALFKDDGGGSSASVPIIVHPPVKRLGSRGAFLPPSRVVTPPAYRGRH